MRRLNELSSDQIASAYQTLARSSKEFMDQFGHLDADRFDKLDLRTRSSMLHLWSAIHRSGYVVSRHVVETRAIPKGQAKAVELAARAMAVRRPRNLLAWWHKNMRHITTLLRSGSWPARGEETGDVIDVGPFHVHDTVHLTGAKLDRTLDVIDQAALAISRSDAAFSRVLYGPVYVVGRLRVPGVLAWYFLDDDIIYLRPMPKDASREIFTLIHELGHRYWNRFMDRDDHKAWTTRHFRLLHTPVTTPKPEVGDLILVRGHDAPVPILEIRMIPPLADLQAVFEGNRRISVMQLWNTRDKRALAKMFPTSYAMKDAQEHFCEAFAMHVLGTLPPDHEAFFEQWLEGSTSRAVNPLKRRLLRLDAALR